MKIIKTILPLTAAFILTIFNSHAQNTGFQVEGIGFGAQQRITDTISGNSLVLQSGSGSNLKISGYNYKTATGLPLYFSVDGAHTLLNPNGGSVGIGTTSPLGGYLLDVAGPVRSFANTTHFVAQTTGGTNSWARYYMRSTAQSWFIGTSQAFNGNQFYVVDETYNKLRFTIQPNGGPIWLQSPVGINTINTAGYALAVNGNIRSKEVIVETNWADYVFTNDYLLMPLEEVEKYIHQHKHLPNIPSEKEIKEHGLALGSIQTMMMEKIEELTLHVIQLQNEINELKKH